MWLWALVSLAAGAGAIALGVTGIVQCSALFGTTGYPGNFPSSPLGVRTIAVMVLCIGSLVACAVMAFAGLFALFGVRWAVLLYALATFLGFLAITGQVLLANPVGYTDPVSRYGVDYNGHPLAGLPMWGGVIVLILFLASLALTKPVYRYALARSGSGS